MLPSLGVPLAVTFGPWSFVFIDVPALGGPRPWKPLLHFEGGASVALGWGSLDEGGLWHLWGPLGGGLPPVVVRVGFQLSALGEHRGLEPVGLFLLAV